MSFQSNWPIGKRVGLYLRDPGSMYCFEAKGVVLEVVEAVGALVIRVEALQSRRGVWGSLTNQPIVITAEFYELPQPVVAK
jgi:hypothetical protein